MISTHVVHQSSKFPSLRAHRADITILLVDDDAILLALLREILIREGYKVVTANSPVLAMELASKMAFSILVTDFDMPEMNGFALASRLASSRAALPVVIISGSTPTEILLAEISSRHWNFMSKPIDRKRFLRIIDGECLGWAVRVKTRVAKSETGVASF